jgi:hypothetical protein
LPKKNHLLLTPNESSKVKSNLPTAAKTTNSFKHKSGTKSVKSRRNDRNIHSERKQKGNINGSRNNAVDFINKEGSDTVADEEDPTTGWIKLNKNSISRVPNEEKRFDSFWKDRNDRYSSSENSLKYSERVSAVKQKSNKSNFRQRSKGLRTALAQSEKRISHFNEYKSKSPKRNEPAGRITRLREAEE